MASGPLGTLGPNKVVFPFATFWAIHPIHIFSLLLAITKLSVDTAESIEAGKPLVENPGAGNWREKTGNTSERNPARDVFTIWWNIIISGEIPAPSGHQILVKCYHLWWILFRLLWKIQGLVTTWREKTGITSTKNPARNIFTILWKIITSIVLYLNQKSSSCKLQVCYMVEMYVHQAEGNLPQIETPG